MDSDLRRKIEMAVRVRDFLRTRPFGAPNADGVIVRFDERVGRGQVLIEQVEAGERAVRGSIATRGELRRELSTEVLRHLARIARAAAKEKSDVAEKFKLPRAHGSEQEFRATARTIAAEIAANKELFLKHGMWEGAVDHLDSLLDRYDQAVADGHAGRAAHTGARAELKALGRELMAMVKQLEGMLLMKFRDDPNLKGAWASARNVAWPTSTAKEATRPSASGPEKAA